VTAPENNTQLDPLPPLSVLFVEDSADDVELMLHALQRNGILIAKSLRVETEPELQAALEQRWDAVISDYRLPSFSGPAALAIASAAAPGVPCIVASGAIGEEAAAELMRSGAVDFVTKDHLDRLAEALRRSVNDAVQRRRRSEAEARLAALRERAAAMTAELADLQRRRANVIELNDEVLQRLVLARACLVRRDPDAAERAVGEALTAVRDIMSRLLPSGIEPGMLRMEPMPNKLRSRT
jgi:DNA-binding NtrC family response regulator